MSAPAAIVCAKMMYPDEEDKYCLPDEELDVKVHSDPANRETVNGKQQKDRGIRKYVCHI